MKIILFCCSLGLTLLSQTVSAGIYRWTDAAGHIHYSDNPPPEVSAQAARIYDNKIDADKLSFNMRQAVKNFPVTLYTGAACGTPCAEAKEFLQKRKLPFTEKAIATQNDIAALQKATRKTANNILPTLMVGNQAIEGFQAAAWGSALDDAGYPK